MGGAGVVVVVVVDGVGGGAGGPTSLAAEKTEVGSYIVTLK